MHHYLQESFQETHKGALHIDAQLGAWGGQSRLHLVSRLTHFAFEEDPSHVRTMYKRSWVMLYLSTFSLHFTAECRTMRGRNKEKKSQKTELGINDNSD